MQRAPMWWKQQDSEETILYAALDVLAKCLESKFLGKSLDNRQGPCDFQAKVRRKNKARQVGKASQGNKARRGTRAETRLADIVRAEKQLGTSPWCSSRHVGEEASSNTGEE